MKRKKIIQRLESLDWEFLKKWNISGFYALIEDNKIILLNNFKLLGMIILKNEIIVFNYKGNEIIFKK